MYQDVVKFQLWLLHVYPGLLPLAALAFSLLSSWHCALMCGPLVGNSSKKSTSQLLGFRLISYTLTGAALGFFGTQLKNSLEFEAVGAMAFVIFSSVTLFCVLPNVFRPLKKISAVQILNKYRGLGWAAIPCHLLMFFYGIAILSSSTVAGALILFGHAVMTTPALVYANSLLKRASHAPKTFALLAKSVLILLIAFNLFYFLGILLAGDTAAKSKMLFCF